MATVVRVRELDLGLDDDVYEPAEDSLLLADRLAELGSLEGRRALDLGTGTGLQALVLARAGAHVVAVDANPSACRLARANARRNGLADRVDVVRGDLLEPLRARARFDVVACNPPYLPSAPEERVAGWLDHAFHGGEGGVEVAQRVVAALPMHLAPQGVAFLVASTRGDLDALRAAVRQAELEATVEAEERFFFEGVQVWRLERP